MRWGHEVRKASLARVSAMVAFMSIAVVVTSMTGCTARLPDITKEGTVPVMLVANGKVLLAAWQPEAAKLDVGTSKPLATLRAGCGFGPFAQVQRTESLICRVESSCVTSWNHQVLTPTPLPYGRPYPSVGPAQWWSGTGADVTTADVRTDWTVASPHVEVPVRLTVTDGSKQTASVDLPHDPVSLRMLTARGDLEDGFILLQWQARGESAQSVEQEVRHLLLIRLQNWQAVARDVPHDEYSNQQYGSAPMTDPYDAYACIGQYLYMMQDKKYTTGQRVWFIDLNDTTPRVHLDMTLTNTVNTILVTAPHTGTELPRLTTSGPYLLLATPAGPSGFSETWAIRDDKLVGRLSPRDGTVQVSAGNLSERRSIKGLTDVLLPSAGALSTF
jgi:hypothetical protein